MGKKHRPHKGHYRTVQVMSHKGHYRAVQVMSHTWRGEGENEAGMRRMDMAGGVHILALA